MNSPEHERLANLIQFHTTADNPYLYKDDKGVLHVTLMRDENSIPVPLNDLVCSAGEIVAMGDYYTSPGWAMTFDIPHQTSNRNQIELGQAIINEPVKPEELAAFQLAYNTLASDRVRHKDITTILDISKTKYIPFSSTLSQYVQEVMLYLKVPRYGETTEKNESHFVPWSIRAFMIAHTKALEYARISYELEQLAKMDVPIAPEISPVVQELLNYTASAPKQRQQVLMELAHRYHAMAVAMELVGFHNYSDSFAAGHMNRMGFLRKELPHHLSKILGSLLVNSMHNEDNRLGVNVKTPYDSHPEDWYPATGDDHVDDAANQANYWACIKGMSQSLMEIEAVRQGKTIPHQTDFNGFDEFPMVDPDKRQTQPMFVLYDDKIYRRTSINKVHILGPTRYEELMSTDPSTLGYERVKGKFSALILNIKLRSPLYKGKIVDLTPDEEASVRADQQDRDPDLNELPCPQSRERVSDKRLVREMLRRGLFVRPQEEAPSAGIDLAPQMN